MKIQKVQGLVESSIAFVVTRLCVDTGRQNKHSVHFFLKIVRGSVSQTYIWEDIREHKKKYIYIVVCLFYRCVLFCGLRVSSETFELIAAKRCVGGKI